MNTTSDSIYFSQDDVVKLIDEKISSLESKSENNIKRLMILNDNLIEDRKNKCKEIEELKKRLESLEKGQEIDDVEMTRMILKTISSNNPNS